MVLVRIIGLPVVLFRAHLELRKGRYIVLRFHQPDGLWGVWLALAVWAGCALAAVKLLAQ